MTKSDTLIKYLQDKGVHLNLSRLGWQKISCYGASHIKGDRNPSASVNLTKGQYKCFGCTLTGDVYDLVQIEKGVDFPTAKAMLGGGQPDEREPTWV